jgi:hypothetical protein
MKLRVNEAGGVTQPSIHQAASDCSEFDDDGG